jgi:hypothetical protein
MENKQINYNLTIEQLDNYIQEFIKQDTRSLSLEECKLSLRIVDDINVVIASTNIVENDRTYYSSCLNSYAALVKQRIYHIIEFGEQ